MDVTARPSPEGAVTLAASDGRHALLSARGDFDRDNRNTLIATVESAFVDGHTDVALDVARVTFIDASVVNALVNCEEDARVQGRTLSLLNCNPLIERILVATGTFTALCGRRRGGEGSRRRPVRSPGRSEAVIARAYEVLAVSRRVAHDTRNF
ncbi:STAS domain-containing protein [Paractinoplanes maris]|uniref:STAS domain-containing protein n=1 Tax=Paractinoplanes maris TaxID=1734446 RepID=UPI00201FDEE1|nr:STAS domain-containing protein [Actinoplanes maris]